MQASGDADIDIVEAADSLSLTKSTTLMERKHILVFLLFHSQSVPSRLYVRSDKSKYNTVSYHCSEECVGEGYLKTAHICACLRMVCKVRNSTCPLAQDKWIFRRTTKIANIVVRRTTWIAAGSVTRQRSSYFGVRF